LNRLCNPDDEEDVSNHVKDGTFWNYHFGNGNQDYLPFDENRVVLKDFPINYVNASWFKLKNTLGHNFIVAQTPIQSTERNFWAMIVENEISLIIMMTGLKEEKGSSKINFEFEQKF